MTLIADNGKCIDTLTKPNYIGIGPYPIANFDQSSLTGCVPLEVTFTDQSTVGTGTIDYWDWQFGPAGSSTESDPTFSFLLGDTSYNIELVVITDAGCRDTISKLVDAYAPLGISAGLDQDICTGQAAQLQARLLDQDAGAQFSWTPVADLSCSNCPNPIASPTDTTIYTLTVSSTEGCIFYVYCSCKCITLYRAGCKYKPGYHHLWGRCSSIVCRRRNGFSILPLGSFQSRTNLL